MLAENGEGLGMRVIAVFVQRFGVLPRELWDLNSISDIGAGRGVVYRDNMSVATLECILNNNRYNIVNLAIENYISHEIELPGTLRRLRILDFNNTNPFDSTGWRCSYDKVLAIPNSLRELELSLYNVPLVFPLGSELLELELGCEHSHPLVLPQRLQRLAFGLTSKYNLPLTFPQTIKSIRFGDGYSQPTILPSGLEELRVGRAFFFSPDLSLPNSLRKIDWCCNRPVQIPEGVSEVTFRHPFSRVVELPSSLRKVNFFMRVYSQPMNFPEDLEELEWRVEEYQGLVLPEGLRKLIWTSSSSVQLPLGLKELVLERDVPMILPEGLLKVVIRDGYRRHCNLPESVQEVVVCGIYTHTFTHPTILRHLRVIYYHNCRLNLSKHRIHKLTIDNRNVRIKKWPQGLKEVAFTFQDDMHKCLRVPAGCKIVGEERPRNVRVESTSNGTWIYLISLAVLLCAICVTYTLLGALE